ncbi:MAG TPA: hypothetical protein VIW68_14285 [Candidatus Sulfotelmatobacter sp.]
MRNTQAWAWLTAGVVALGLNGFYHDGGAAWAHRVAQSVSDRADYAIERVSGRAEQILAQSQMPVDGVETGREETGRVETASCRVSTALAQMQTRMARTQTAVAHFNGMSAREQAQGDRWQAEQDRVEARVQAQIERQMARVRVAADVVDPVEIRVACPRVRVNVPAVRIPAVDVGEISIPKIQIPEIHVPGVSIPRTPSVRITAPAVSGDESDSGPI